MYDGLDWLEKQIALLNIVEDPLLGRTLIVPALINTPGIEIKKEMFEKTAKAYEVIIDLIFIKNSLRLSDVSAKHFMSPTTSSVAQNLFYAQKQFIHITYIQKLSTFFKVL